MKLSEFNRDSALLNRPGAIDIDVATRVGPEIVKRVNELDMLCKFMPNNAAMIAKLTEFKELMNQTTPVSSNVLEQLKVAEMYSSLLPEYGNGTWAVVSRNLQEQGYDKPTVDEMIDRAILAV